jgi:ketosteroid isomerase-like protein
MRFKRRRGLKMFAVAALLPMMAVAQVSKAAPAEQDPAVQEVAQTVRDFMVNTPTYQDGKPFQEFFANDLSYTTWVGSIMSKADILGRLDFRAEHRKGSYEVEDLTAHVYGDGIAIVNWLLKCPCEESFRNGKTLSLKEEFRETATLLKRDGKWRAIAVNETKIEHSQNTWQGSQPPDSAVVDGPAEAETSREITQLVRDFLANVPRNDPRVFDEFFADDVIYTRATAVTVTKGEILKNIDVRAASTPEATFAADRFIVHTYGDLAVVNFRLIGHNVEKGAPTTYFRNTGTFLKRDGRWQAVAWQATKMPLESK